MNTSATTTLLTRALLTLVAITGYGFIVLKVLESPEFSPSVEKIAIFLLGALTTSVVTMVNFWFQSSQSSADKNSLVERNKG